MQPTRIQSGAWRAQPFPTEKLSLRAQSLSPTVLAPVPWGRRPQHSPCWAVTELSAPCFPQNK